MITKQLKNMKLQKTFKGIAAAMFLSTFVYIIVNKLNYSHMDYEVHTVMLIFWLGAIVINKK